MVETDGLCPTGTDGNDPFHDLRNGEVSGMKQTAKVLALNCGSSSAKYSVWEMPQCNMLCSGIVERVTVGGSFIRHQLSKKVKCMINTNAPTMNWR